MRRLLLFASLVPVVACAPPPPPVPTPNVGATVQSQVRATIEARPTATVVATAAAVRFKIGGNAWIARDPGNVYLGEDARAVADYLKVAEANDQVGLVDLLAKGRLVSAAGGTKVLVLESAYGGDLVRVRLLEGPKAPRAGWLPEEWLSEQP